MTAYLEGISGEYAGRRIPLGFNQLNIGRSSKSHLRLKAANISREHATIYYTNGVYAIHDRNSQLGTFINNRCVENAQLRNGDVITIGANSFRFVQTVQTSHTPKQSYAEPARTNGNIGIVFLVVVIIAAGVWGISSILNKSSGPVEETYEPQDNYQEESALDLVEIKPIFYEETLGESGWKNITFVISIENISDNWILFDENAWFSRITTEKDFEYTFVDNCTGYVGTPPTFISSNKYLPPGFRVQSFPINCQVPETSQSYTLVLLMKIASDPLTGDYPSLVYDVDWTEISVPLDRIYETGPFPFINKDGWQEYRQNPPKGVHIVDANEKIQTPFGYVYYESIDDDRGESTADFYINLCVFNNHEGYELDVDYGSTAFTMYDNLYGYVRGESEGIGPLSESCSNAVGEIFMRGKIIGPTSPWFSDMPKSEMVCAVSNGFWYALRDQENEDKFFPFPHIICFDTTGMDIY
jgi:pSer/pThr/pTyr-binding forkhead associated (FHA) protein